MSLHDCDLCQSSEAIEVPFAREYTGNQPIHICCGCGFVYVRERRTAQEIAASWSGLYDGTYSPRSPAVLARLTYVAATINQQIGIAGKSVCDIGAGDGTFLEMVRGMGATPFGVEPSAAGERIKELDFAGYGGTIEDYIHARRYRIDSPPGALKRPLFDIVTINWSLENCSDCVGMLRRARKLLKPDGRLVVATGSRILVPPRKPLHKYLGTNPADTHAFRFSANSLCNALRRAGFEVEHINSYVDSDVLLLIGAPSLGVYPFRRPDDANAVAEFFARWHREWP
jgi:2-polyprenyl-3-methyl-5-hydroxy-6-metoxy-1,4-benzoquinol methylase